MPDPQPGIFTIGHSTLAADEFLERLLAHEIQLLVDIRAHPGSRRLPHFSRRPLGTLLAGARIDYLHVPGLGGRRRTAGDPDGSIAGAWRNASFRSYALHTRSPEYQTALAEIAELGSDRRLVLMCAEAVPWRCHRWLVADTLVARGWQVGHIMGTSPARPHTLNPFARVDGDDVCWPAPSPVTGPVQ